MPFDPLHDAALPDGVDGLVVGGGFPEVFGEALAANAPLLADVADRVRGGLVTWAECGGLLWLARSLDGRAMCGVIDADAAMIGPPHPRLPQRHDADGATPLAAAGAVVRGHEFHYSSAEPAGDALDAGLPLRRAGPEGYATPTCWRPTCTCTSAPTPRRRSASCGGRRCRPRRPAPRQALPYLVPYAS